MVETMNAATRTTRWKRVKTAFSPRIFAQKVKNGVAATFNRENMKDAVTPRIASSFFRYHNTKMEILASNANGPEQEAKIKKAKKNPGKELLLAAAKVAGSATFYQFTATTYGVDARDYGLKFSAEESWSNTSRISLNMVRLAASFIPQHRQEQFAAAAIPVEWALSAVRIYVEQGVWKRFGITPDPAGTLLTPLLAGILEFGYKATVQYPSDPQTRLAVGLIGIYGNIVRICNAVLIYAAGSIATARNEQ